MHCNLVKNDYQHASKVLFTFVSNKQFGQLINISPHSLTMMNTINIEFSFAEVRLTGQVSKALEIENIVLALIKMSYSTGPKFRKYVKGYSFLLSARKFGDKYGKKLMETATKTGIDTTITASKRVILETEKATGDLIGNKIADKVTSLGKTKSKEKEDERQEIYIPPEKRQQIIEDFDTKWNTKKSQTC